MGLDSIELLVEVEKAFGITIPSQEAVNIITVGNFQDKVWHYVSHRKKGNRCKSQNLFYKLRGSLQAYGNPIKSLKPDSPLNDIIPKENRRSYWRKLALENNLEFSKLVLPKFYFTLLLYIVLIIIIGGLAVSDHDHLL